MNPTALRKNDGNNISGKYYPIENRQNKKNKNKNKKAKTKKNKNTHAHILEMIMYIFSEKVNILHPVSSENLA